METIKGKSPIKEQSASADLVVFSKQKVLSLQRYANRRDLLSVLLNDGENYTLDQVNSLVNDFMKGKVK